MAKTDASCGWTCSPYALSCRAATSQTGPLHTCRVAGETVKLNFKLHFILSFILESDMWLVATTLADPASPSHCFFFLCKSSALVPGPPSEAAWWCKWFQPWSSVHTHLHTCVFIYPVRPQVARLSHFTPLGRRVRALPKQGDSQLGTVGT